MAAVCLAGGSLVAAQSPGRIDLVTLPPAGEVELTIYNPADLTLVTERRTVSFPQGESEMQFSWAGTLIDPTSVRLSLPDEPDWLEILDLRQPNDARDTLIWRFEAAHAGSAALELNFFVSGVHWAADYVVTASEDETTLSLASYVRITNDSGMDLEQVKTRLLVGEASLVEEIAQLARRVGPMNLVRHILTMPTIYISDAENNNATLDNNLFVFTDAFTFDADGAYDPTNGTTSSGDVWRFAGEDLGLRSDLFYKRLEIAKEAVGEYFLYTVEGRADIANGLSQRLPSLDADDIATTVTYLQDAERFGPELTKIFKFRNEDAEAAAAGDEPEGDWGATPLPEGFYHAFRRTADAALRYEGRHDEKYVPIGEEVELNVGPDGLVVLEERTMRFVRENLEFGTGGDVIGWDEVRDMRLEARNSRPDEVALEIARHFAGDFDFEALGEAADAALWTQEDLDSWKLETPLAGGTEARFNYRMRVRQGSRAKK